MLCLGDWLKVDVVEPGRAVGILAVDCKYVCVLLVYGSEVVQNCLISSHCWTRFSEYSESSKNGLEIRL